MTIPCLIKIFHRGTKILLASKTLVVGSWCFIFSASSYFASFQPSIQSLFLPIFSTVTTPIVIHYPTPPRTYRACTRIYPRLFPYHPSSQCVTEHSLCFIFVLAIPGPVSWDLGPSNQSMVIFMVILVQSKCWKMLYFSTKKMEMLRKSKASQRKNESGWYPQERLVTY